MTLNIKNLYFAYKKDLKILDDISISLEQGNILGILGPNGTGKTTFIKCINRIHEPLEGEIIFEDRNLRALKHEDVAKIIAYVPQYINTSFSMSVIDAVMMGRLPYAKRSYSEDDKRIVFDVIRSMELEDFAFRNIRELSGGERQRVFVARALAQNPKMIILDEPTSSLDLHNQLFILRTIEKVAREKNITIVMTIHDLNLAAMFCDKILMLKNKKIFAYGSTDEVLTEDNVNTMYKVNTKITEEEGYKHIRLLRE